MGMDIQKIRGLKNKTGVLDNNILNDFAELGCVPLLNQVFESVYVPQSILDKEATLEDLKNCLDQLEYGTIATTTVDSLIFLKEISEEPPWTF